MSVSTLFPESWGLQNTANTFPEQEASAGLPEQGSHYGETIRGMMYVSPLVEMKQAGLSLQDIISKYFPDAKPQHDGHTTTYCDVNSSFDEIQRTKDDFIYSNTNAFAFSLYVFYSTDAIKLAEAFECLKTGKQQVVFFIEDNSGDNSERYAAVKISDDLAVTLKNGLNADVKKNPYLYNAVQKVLPGLTDGEIQEVLLNGHLAYRTTEKIATFAQAGFYLTGLMLTAIMPGFGLILFSNANIGSKAFEAAADFINKAKLDDHHWNPEAKKRKSDGSEDPSYTPKQNFSPFFFPGAEEVIEDSGAAIDKLVETGVAAAKAKIAEQDSSVRKLLGIKEGNEQEGLNGYIYLKYKNIIASITEVLDGFKGKELPALIKGGIRAANAFLCGLWNGLVDALSGIFLMVKYVFDAIALMQNAGKQLPVLTEHIDNVMQALSQIDFGVVVSYFKQKITDSEGNLYLPYLPIAYFCGAVYGFIIALAIEIAIGILATGGALSIAAVAERLGSIFTSIFRAGASLAKGVMGTVRRVIAKTSEAVFAMLSGITAFLRKGTKELLKVIDNLFDFFKSKSDEVAASIDDLTLSETDWMTQSRTGNLGGKVLKAGQIRKLRGILKKKGITLIVKGDPKSIKKLFKPIDKIKSFDELIAFMDSFDPPRVGGFDPVNKQFILNRNPTEIISFHEMAHVKHFEEVTEEVYKGLSKLEKEMYVWKQIVKYRDRWTKAELDDALRYINQVRKEAGLEEPLKLK